MAKSLTDTFLYGKSPDYNKQIYTFMAKANRIDTKSAEFADVLFDLKRRRVSDSLAKILTSKNVVLATYEEAPLPKTLRVFVAKDIQDKGKVKLFIDATQFIKFNSGVYDCTNIDWLVSYAIAGMVSYIYAQMPQRLLLDSSVISDGCDCFMRLFSYGIDYMYKITSVQTIKQRVDYLAGLYYQFNLLDKDLNSESQCRIAKNNAMKIANIEQKDAKVVDMQLAEHDFDNLDTFLKCVARICDLKDMKIDAFVGTWIRNTGTGAIFALEYFPAFSMMLTNTYVGGYIDNQITIEKICGNALVAFVKSILKIGESVV